jgi:hypothetical protein
MMTVKGFVVLRSGITHQMHSKLNHSSTFNHLSGTVSWFTVRGAGNRPVGVAVG